MALYEGIALIQEKQAVVLDLGTDYTKFGFTGEAAPRCIIRSEFWCPAERRYKRVHDYHTAEELYENLVHMLHLLYFRHVLVNPKERKVVVVESLLTPTLFRETLAKVLFTHYEVSGVVWADSPRLCAITLGTPVALVVSIGAREAEVSAVVHASVVLRAIQSQPLAARAIHDELARLLDDDNNTELHLPDHIIEDIKVKTCFVGPRSRAVQWASDKPPAPAKSVQYPLPNRAAITVSGRTRELAAEPLFARDNELASLPDIVLQCIIQRPPLRPRVQVPQVRVARRGVRVDGRRAGGGGGRRRARAPAGRVRARAPPARLALPARQHAARPPPPRHTRLKLLWNARFHCWQMGTHYTVNLDRDPRSKSMIAIQIDRVRN